MVRKHSRTLMRSSYSVVGAIGLGSVTAALPSGAQAQSIDVTKVVTWTNAKAPANGINNTLYYYVGAFAQDFGTPNPADPESDPAKPVMTQNGPIVAVNQKNAASSTFDATKALAAVQKTSGMAKSGAANALATTSLSATAPAAGPLGTSQVMTTINEISTVNVGPKTVATAYGYSSFSIDSGMVTGNVIQQKGKMLTTTPAIIGKPAAGIITTALMWKDPIFDTVYDSSNNLIASQELAELDASSNAEGSFEWDSSGITLTAPKDGSSSADLYADIGDVAGNGQTSGTWVTDTDTGTSFANLSGGVLSLGGIFNTSGWVVSPDGSMATLSPGALSSVTIDYTPSVSSLSPTGMYYEQLENDESNILEATEPGVPEPGMLSLLTVSGSFAFMRRRRAIPKDQSDINFAI